MRKQTKGVPLPRGGKVTLEMVAQASGVSPSTVSRILNGTAIVSGDKRAAVDQAIAQLGFVPNPIARGLAGGRTMSVGVVTQTIDSPFYGVALRGIEEALGQAGYSALFVSGHWDAETEKRCIETLRVRRVDGLIILNARLGNPTLKALAKTLPVVITGRTLKAPDLYALDFDNFEGARLATHHLLALGHRDIVHIAGDPEHLDAIARLRGYRAALEAAGLPYRPELVLPGMYFEDSGRMAVERLLDSRVPFSAIFAANDQMAFGAAVALHAHGLRVPEHVSLVGFDDLASSAFVVPPLTTVHQAGLELGRVAAASLLALLGGQTPQQQLPAPRLIVRGSTRAVAAAKGGRAPRGATPH
jgi:LacI family transcriptional regulator